MRDEYEYKYIKKKPDPPVKFTVTLYRPKTASYLDIEVLHGELVNLDEDYPGWMIL